MIHVVPGQPVWRVKLRAGGACDEGCGVAWLHPGHAAATWAACGWLVSDSTSTSRDTPTTLLVFGSEADALPLASALGCIEPAWGAVLANGITDAGKTAARGVRHAAETIMHGLRWASTEYVENVQRTDQPAPVDPSVRAIAEGAAEVASVARGVGELVVGGVAGAAFLMGKTVTESAKASGVLGDVGERPEARAAERVSQAGLMAAVSLTHSPSPCHPHPTLLASILNPNCKLGRGRGSAR